MNMVGVRLGTLADITPPSGLRSMDCSLTESDSSSVCGGASVLWMRRWND